MRFTLRTGNTARHRGGGCVPTRQGWLYLAIVVDLYARRIVGWAQSRAADAWLAVKALRMSMSQRKPVAGGLFHSDQGSQYTSKAFAAELQQHGWISSKWGASSTGRRVKVYSITSRGETQLGTEEADWHRAAGIVTRFFKLSKG